MMARASMLGRTVRLVRGPGGSLDPEDWALGKLAVVHSVCRYSATYGVQLIGCGRTDTVDPECIQPV